MQPAQAWAGGVALIGVGSMGAAIAPHLLRAGHPLTLCDTDAARLAPLAGQGARVAQDPAGCAGAAAVLVLVATPAQVREVTIGPRGLLAGLASHARHRPDVALMSTVPPALVHELAGALGDAVAGLVDAPISGGSTRAEAGTLTVMAGGDDAAFERLRPVFACFARDIFHCGAQGAGQAMKIVNNIVGNANVIVSAEAYRLAGELGLSIEDTARVLDAAMGRNVFSGAPASLPATYAALTRDRPGFDSVLAIMRKDIGIAAGLCPAVERYPAIHALKKMTDSLGDATFENWQHLGRRPLDRT